MVRGGSVLPHEKNDKRNINVGSLVRITNIISI